MSSVFYNSTMIKAVLLDVDGVILRPREKYFSEWLRDEGYTVDLEKVGMFFKNEYKDVVVGRADLKTEIATYLASWGWEGSVDELLRFWFSKEDVVNEEVLGLVSKIRKDGVKCYMASDHSRYRADDLREKIGSRFDGDFFSGYVGYTKDEVGYYEYVVETLDLDAEEVLFVDDDSENVEVARTLGIEGVYFEQDTGELKNTLSVVGYEHGV